MKIEAGARPDLSGLDRETRINIAVAETQGATWRFDGKPLGGGWPGGWFFSTPEDPNAAWLSRHGRFGGSVPQYTRDPAAWGALMEKEGVWPEPLFDRDGGVDSWVGNYRAGADLFERTAIVSTPGEAVALAVLAKHGVEVPQ